MSVLGVCTHARERTCVCVCAIVFCCMCVCNMTSEQVEAMYEEHAQLMQQKDAEDEEQVNSQ